MGDALEMPGKHKAKSDTICLITTKIQPCEDILLSAQRILCIVVVSRTPSHLYKFVQLAEQLKEKKKSIWVEKQQKLDYLGQENLPAVSEIV